VIILALAVLLPSLFWDQGPDTAAALRDAGITHVSVPQSMAQSWQSVSGISVEVADAQGMRKLPAPSVQFQINKASATRSPWVNANGWRYLRYAGSKFYCDAPGKAAALAAAEAYTYGAGTLIHTDTDGLKPLGQMLQFLGTLHEVDLPPVSDIRFIDDGSPQSSELMNLLIRRNLLFRIVRPGDSGSGLVVQVGSKEYPKAEAANPSLLAEKVRANLTDEKRSLRIYGSDVVIARLLAENGSARLFLINYESGHRAVEGIRVRVAGDYSKHSVSAYDAPERTLIEYSMKTGATEFTLPELKTYAVVDLTR
jgi:hypothetical protein